MKTLLIFDLDGTLINSADIILAAQVETFAAFGIAMPERERALSIVGLSLAEAFETLLGRDAPIPALCDHYKLSFNRIRTGGLVEEPLFAGASERVVHYAGDGDAALAIATGKTRRGVDYVIDKHGWHGMFGSIQTADDAPSKPHPAMIRQACAETGFAEGQAIMIGDSSFDMAMARAAGARAIGVNWGFQSPDRLIEAGAEAIAEDYDHLDRLIAGMRR